MVVSGCCVIISHRESGLAQWLTYTSSVIDTDWKFLSHRVGVKGWKLVESFLPIMTVCLLGCYWLESVSTWLLLASRDVYLVVIGV